MATTILVTGGAGYIGAHAVLSLRAAGYPVVVLDDLSTGMRAAVPDDVPLVVGDVGDRELVASVLTGYGVGAVMHFAGSIIVPESVTDPLKYYGNNTAASRNLLAASVAQGVRAFVFSSTAAVYGEPDAVPIPETAPTRPINPYGTSKLMTEWMLADSGRAYGLAYAALRYFNVAGADPWGRCGQATPEATHLIKVACEAAVGKRDEIAIFGTDYPTADGTCIRDYIHVVDLAEAHVRALDHLLGGGDSLVLNCGYGRGHSVREVLDAVAAAAGHTLPVRAAARRPGDPARLVADPGRLKAELGWAPQYADLTTICRHALAWERIMAGQSG